MGNFQNEQVILSDQASKSLNVKYIKTCLQYE